MLTKLTALRKRHQRKISAALGISLVIIWSLELLPTALLPSEVATAYSFSIIVFFLLLISDSLNNSTTTHIAPGRQSLNTTITEYIAEKRVKRAVFILYSGGVTIRTHVDHLIDENVDVTVLMQHPDTCTSRVDREKILASLRSIHYGHDRYPNPNLHLYLYKPRGSFRAVALDDQFLAVSWYTFVRADDASDRISQAPPNPQIIAYAPSSEYNHLKTMFDGVLEDLKKDAVPFEEFIQQESL